ncbi:hypothetical protein [Cohnella zeiphila]|uniref:Uncharacterized protein n=1 Tax=Cohnella zeiphila TaxID=2761120 RepID=A0A7X0SPK1_9BACL|nr:hypothetical protein [Cohnella zeiphila]MBB6733812.1 hypothetical protein [Cohnella zeiphila]
MIGWRKAFSLSDLRHGWLLALSVVVCGAFFWMDQRSASDDQFWLSVGYGVSFAVAVLWSAVNYISHIRLNAMYRQMNDIEAYVRQLAMSEEDRLELRNYLEDYAQDLTAQGRTKEQATAEAISQFKVKELLSLSKNTELFHLPAHYYLFGWTVLAWALLAALTIVGDLFEADGTGMVIAQTILAVYGAALAGLFFVYKVLDAAIHRKLQHHFS